MGMLDQDMGGTEESAPAEETAAQEQQTAPEPQPERKEHVAIGGRRAAAAKRNDEVMEKLKSVETSLAKKDEEYRAELSRRDAEIARLRGGFEAIQPLIQQRQQGQGNAEPDPADLRRQARQALDQNRDIDTYERLRDEANRIEILREMKKNQPQQQAQPAVDPGLQMETMMHISRFPQLQKNPQQAMQLAAWNTQKLVQFYGHQFNSETRAKAFEMAAQEMGAGGGQSPQFSQQAAGALSGVPTSRSNGNGSNGSRGQGVELTEHEKFVARMAGMSLQEYAEDIAKNHPDRVVT